ncbi:hypothetical protein Golob_020940, partial [Gossypium lobatum]|nr:hypothetical protein [Gossypium lobatum]
VVPEAQKFRISGIDPEFKAPSSGTLPSEFFEDIDNDILEENEEENVINDVHIDGNNKKNT